MLLKPIRQSYGFWYSLISCLSSKRYKQDYAIAIAKRYNAELNAVNVLTSDIGYAYSSPGVESPPLTVREIILLAEDEAKEWFNKIKEKADESGIRFRTEFIVAKRSIVSAMLDYAEEQNINLIVVGTGAVQALRKCCLEVSL
ncbi:MAG TPA: universal stress protein [Nitrososphaeraceae archaeon]|nr:universal stress protein [Nitrososphaeraceae archaeon]